MQPDSLKKRSRELPRKPRRRDWRKKRSRHVKLLKQRELLRKRRREKELSKLSLKHRTNSGKKLRRS